MASRVTLEHIRRLTIMAKLCGGRLLVLPEDDDDDDGVVVD